jgi:hypothetical protein
MKKNRNIARKHHFVTQGYLAAFTDDGTLEGQLVVFDLVSSSIFRTRPLNVAAERDFNRIDLDGQDPDALERSLGEFESRAVSTIRGIEASGELPKDEEFSYPLNLMALMIVRNPRLRRNMNKAREHTARIIGDMLVSDRRLYEHHLSKAKKDGFVPPEAEARSKRCGILSKEINIRSVSAPERVCRWSWLGLIMPCGCWGLATGRS